MIASSRPLRFLALAIGGWIALRAVQLWPGADPARTIVQALAPSATADAAVGAPRGVPARAGSIRATPPIASPSGVPSRPAFASSRGPMVETSQMAQAVPAPQTIPSEPERSLSVPLAGNPITPVGSAPSRFAGSAWLIARGGGGAVPFAPQLGGSQAGARLTYALGRRLMAAARVSAALGSRQREAAIGFDWRPTRLPIHLVVEQRIAVEQARGGPSVGVIGGLVPTPIARGFMLEGYGQAGFIGRDGGEGYADGSLRLSRLIAQAGRARLDLGVGAWGAAQRGAARLDLGPAASVTLPVADRAIRVSAEWRARVAGNARPASGPAVSIGADF